MIKNLISTKDITAIKKKHNLTGDELQLLQQESFKEQQLQMNCKRIFDNLSYQFTDSLSFFQQNDNGGYGNMATKIIKKAEGTISGWPDVTLWKFSKDCEKSIFIEFKKLAITKMSKHQEHIHKQLSDAGKEVYLCNNTVYFEKVICKEFFDLK